MAGNEWRGKSSPHTIPAIGLHNKPSLFKTGAPGRTRTCYPRLRRPMLYPDELQARNQPACQIILVPSHSQPGTMSGRGREIRTPDILLPKQARYQTALYPDSGLRPTCPRQEGGDSTPKCSRRQCDKIETWIKPAQAVTLLAFRDYYIKL